MARQHSRIESFTHIRISPLGSLLSAHTYCGIIFVLGRLKGGFSLVVELFALACGKSFDRRKSRENFGHTIMADWREEKWGACVLCVATIDAKSFAIRRRGFPSFLVLTLFRSRHYRLGMILKMMAAN